MFRMIGLKVFGPLQSYSGSRATVFKEWCKRVPAPCHEEDTHDLHSVYSLGQYELV